MKTYLKTITIGAIAGGYNSFNGELFRGDFPPLIEQSVYKKVQKIILNK